MGLRIQNNIEAFNTHRQLSNTATLAGKTYTTTWFDMWRFVDGKADEHWDFGTVAGQGNPADCARVGGPAPAAPPAGGRGQR